MSSLRNRVQLIGHVGNDPEVKIFDDGRKVIIFRMATSDSYKNDKGEKVENTQWHNIRAWGKTADISENYVTKGKKIAIQGKLTYREYLSKTGEKRYTAEIVTDEILMLEK